MDDREFKSRQKLRRAFLNHVIENWVGNSVKAAKAELKAMDDLKI